MIKSDMRKIVLEYDMEYSTKFILKLAEDIISLKLPQKLTDETLAAIVKHGDQESEFHRTLGTTFHLVYIPTENRKIIIEFSDKDYHIQCNTCGSCKFYSVFAKEIGAGCAVATVGCTLHKVPKEKTDTCGCWSEYVG